MHRRSNKFSDCKVIVLKSINEANVQDCTVVSIGLMIEAVEGLNFSSDAMHTLPNCRRQGGFLWWTAFQPGFPLCSLRWFWVCFICQWDPQLFLVKISRRPSLRRRRELCQRSWVGLLILYLSMKSRILYPKSFSCMKACYIDDQGRLNSLFQTPRQ